MKRAIAAALAALLLCAGMAQAAEWADGRSPGKPYVDVPEVNLDENIGYMMFYPNASVRVQYACQRLLIYLPREDVKAGDGVLTVSAQKGGKVWSTAMSDETTISQRPISESELEGLLWGGGTCFEIKLSKTLDLGKDYYVTLAQGCIVSEDGNVASPAVSETDRWTITVDGEFGVSGMEYLHEGKSTSAPEEGDAIRFNLELGGDAAAAIIYGYNGTVSFLTTMYTESTKVEGSVIGSDPAWGVLFLDAENNEIEHVDFY